DRVERVSPGGVVPVELVPLGAECVGDVPAQARVIARDRPGVLVRPGLVQGAGVTVAFGPGAHPVPARVMVNDLPADAGVPLVPHRPADVIAHRATIAGSRRRSATGRAIRGG